MSSTVHVEGISNKTSEKEVRDFFSFCGKISNITVKPASNGSQSADVTFEKNSAAKTALLLDSTQLGDAQVHVKAASTGAATETEKSESSGDHHEVAQEDKPRSRIMAEYIAHGYRLGDQVIQRGIAFDQQHGISNRFTNALQNFDKKYDATGKAASVDDKYKVTDKATGAFNSMYSYYDAAMGTPTGQKLRSFYEQGQKQVLDVHNEAMHLANLSGGNQPKSVDGGSRTKCNCGANTEKCPCSPGTCACSKCAKNPDEGKLEKLASGRTKCNCGADTDKCPCAPGTCACSKCEKNPEVNKLESVDGGKRTKCNCGANTDKCPCAPGTCACSSCAKNPEVNKLESVDGGKRTKCNCGANTEKCPCAPGTCACSSCMKNPDVNKLESVDGGKRTKCNCGANTNKCPCAPGTCACSSCAKNPDVKTSTIGAEEAGLHKVGSGDKTACNCGSSTDKCPCEPGKCTCGSCAKNPESH